MDTPLPNAYWVTPHLLAGDHPGLFAGLTASRVRTLLDADIGLFVNLSILDEAESYQQYLGRADYRSFPMRGMIVPSQEKMVRILDTVGEAISAGRLVYVHCRSGLGRTGTVVGCFLVGHGMDGEEALATITKLRLKTNQAWKSSSETEP